jgi:hypothetical protein
MVRNIRNIAFVVLMLTLVVASRQELDAYDCNPWTCTYAGCSGTCYSCGMMAQACMEHCGGSGGLVENLQCQDVFEPPSASGSCGCIYPE